MPEYHLSECTIIFIYICVDEHGQMFNACYMHHTDRFISHMHIITGDTTRSIGSNSIHRKRTHNFQFKYIYKCSFIFSLLFVIYIFFLCSHSFPYNSVYVVLSWYNACVSDNGHELAGAFVILQPKQWIIEATMTAQRQAKCRTSRLIWREAAYSGKRQ